MQTTLAWASKLAYIYSPLSYIYSGSLAAVASTTCWPQLSLGPTAPRYTVYALYALCEGATEPL